MHQFINEPALIVGANELNMTFSQLVCCLRFAVRANGLSF